MAGSNAETTMTDSSARDLETSRLRCDDGHWQELL